MAEAPDPLVLDLVGWVARAQRRYDDVLEAWRTSCPRLTVWEDAVDRGLVTTRFARGLGLIVEVSVDGRALLAEAGRSVAA